MESPGDIILALSINEFIKNITYLINAIYYFSEETGPFTNSSFCQLSGGLIVISQYIEDYYNIIFCLLILIKIRYLLKEAKIPRILYHLFIFLAVIMIGILLKHYQRIGKNYTGICGLKACLNACAFSVNFIQILNIILVTLTLKYFIKSLPNYSNIRKIKAEIINYLGIYLIGQTLARVFFEIFLLILQINSYKWKWEGMRNLQFLLYFKLIITPVLLLIMRYNHLFMAEIFNKIFFCKYFYHQFLENTDKNENLMINSNEINKNLYMNSSVISAVFTEENLDSKAKNISNSSHLKEKPSKMSLEIDGGSLMNKISNKSTKGKKNSERNEVGFFSINIISYNMKVMLTRSILTGIWLSHTCDEKDKNQEKPPNYEENPSKNEKFHSKTVNSFDRNSFEKPRSFFHRKTMNSNMFLETKRIPIHNNSSGEFQSVFELTMIIYAPEMFKNLLNFDKEMINFDISLNLLKNDKNIKKANNSQNSGKSGEFFFCTHDNKLIIKTLTSNELGIFLKNLENYYNYLTTHKDSLITKIYGVYTFFRKDIDISNHVIIMRNIVNTSKRNIIVSYDLKGSTFDREVLKEFRDFTDKEAAYSKQKTLKDQDFLKFERKIEISSVFKEKLLKNLQEDAVFFRRLGFMDYSFFLVKVRENQRNLSVEMPENPSNPLYSIESSNENGVYYNIGIIDYFQKYTAKKFIEKYWKKLVHGNYGLDTSSQDPKMYAERFMKFMNEIIH